MDRVMRRTYSAGLAGLVLGSVLLMFATGRVWISGAVAAAGLPIVHVSLTGHSVAAASAAFGLLGLAGAAAVALTRGWWRWGLAMLVTAAEACAVVVVLVSVNGTGGQVRAAANGATGSLTTATSAWPFVAALGAALATASAIAISYSTRREHEWSARPEAGSATGPQGASKHEGPEPSSDHEGPRGESSSTPTRGQQGHDLWSAIEQGDDPTA
jgi:hypothetical protein